MSCYYVFIHQKTKKYYYIQFMNKYFKCALIINYSYQLEKKKMNISYHLLNTHPAIYISNSLNQIPYLHVSQIYMKKFRSLNSNIPHAFERKIFIYFMSLDFFLIRCFNFATVTEIKWKSMHEILTCGNKLWVSYVKIFDKSIFYDMNKKREF